MNSINPGSPHYNLFEEFDPNFNGNRFTEPSDSNITLDLEKYVSEDNSNFSPSPTQTEKTDSLKVAIEQSRVTQNQPADFENLPPEITQKILVEANARFTPARRVCKLWNDLSCIQDINSGLITKALVDGRYYDALRLVGEKKLFPDLEIILAILQQLNSIKTTDKVEQLILLKIVEKLITKIPENHVFSETDNFFGLFSLAATNGKIELLYKLKNFPFSSNELWKVISEVDRKRVAIIDQTRPNIYSQISHFLRENQPAQPALFNNAHLNTFETYMKTLASEEDKNGYLRLVKNSKGFKQIEAILSTHSLPWINEALGYLHETKDKEQLLSKTIDERPELNELILTSHFEDNDEERIIMGETTLNFILFLSTNKRQDLIPAVVRERLPINLLPILDACASGNLAVVKELLDSMQNPREALGTFCELIVSITCSSGHLDILRLLTDKNLLADHEDVALIEACESGHSEIVSELLANSDLDFDGYDFLDTCISRGHTDCINLLLKDKRTYDNSCLETSFKMGYLDTYKTIAQAKDLSISDLVENFSTFFVSMAYDEAVPVAQYLFSHPDFKLDELRPKFEEICLSCIRFGQLEMLKVLLDLALPVSIMVLIDKSVTYNQLHILDYLLTKYPNPSSIVPIKDFQRAAVRGHLLLVQRIMSDKRMEGFLTSSRRPSHQLFEETLTLTEEGVLLAAENGHQEVAEFLLAKLKIDVKQHPILKYFDSIKQKEQALIEESKDTEISDVAKLKRSRADMEENLEEVSASTAEEEKLKRRRFEKKELMDV